MQKRKIIIITVLFIVLVGCSKKEENPIHYGVEAKTISFDNLEEMEEQCDIIIKGIRKEKEEIILNKQNSNVVSCYTLSELEITNIINDDSNILKNGDLITILENEAYDEEENIVYHIAGYEMMKTGEEYLLFLNKNIMPDGQIYYVSVGVNFGTIPLNTSLERTTYKTRNGQEVGNTEYFIPIWEEAMKKYK